MVGLGDPAIRVDRIGVGGDGGQFAVTPRPNAFDGDEPVRLVVVRPGHRVTGTLIGWCGEEPGSSDHGNNAPGFSGEYDHWSHVSCHPRASVRFSHH